VRQRGQAGQQAGQEHAQHARAHRRPQQPRRVPPRHEALQRARQAARRPARRPRPGRPPGPRRPRRALPRDGLAAGRSPLCCAAIVGRVRRASRACAPLHTAELRAAARCSRLGVYGRAVSGRGGRGPGIRAAAGLPWALGGRRLVIGGVVGGARRGRCRERLRRRRRCRGCRVCAKVGGGQAQAGRRVQAARGDAALVQRQQRHEGRHLAARGGPSAPGPAACGAGGAAPAVAAGSRRHLDAASKHAP